MNKYTAVMGFMFPCLVESSCPVEPIDKSFVTPMEQVDSEGVRWPMHAAPPEAPSVLRSSASFG